MASSSKKPKILIIEDDATLGEVVVQKLKKHGYQTFLAIDGAQGFKDLTKQKPDLVLLDIVLPGMNGYEILEAMNKNTDLKDIPVIIISNSGQPVELNRAFALGVKDYLIKASFTPDEVLEKVEEFLKKDRAHDSIYPTFGKLGIKTVLLVEDEPLLQSILVTKLKKEKCVVSTAETGEKALRAVKIGKKKPDLILLDIVLPLMSGFEVLKQLQDNKETKDIPVIILSNLTQSSDIKKGMDLGAAGYLVKANLSLTEILPKIRQTLAAFRGKRDQKRIRVVSKS